MNKQNIKVKRGFSLVELLVVLAIIVLMGTVLLTKQNTAKERDEVQAAARQLVAQLRLLQAEAMNGKKVGTSSVYACGHALYASSNSSTYNIKYYPASTSTTVSGCDESNIISGSTQSNLKFESKSKAKTGGAFDLYFAAPRGELYVFNGSTYTSGISAGIILQSLNGSTKYKICISANASSILENKCTTANCNDVSC